MSEQDFAKKIYLTEVEASTRYAFSRAWFQRRRLEGNGPPYLKVRGRILYPLKDTDAWFEGHQRRTSTSCNGVN